MTLISRISVFSILVFVTLFFSSASGQTAYTVVNITVEGNRLTDTNLIKSVAGLDLGSALTATGIQEAIRKLYALGIFSDVRLEAVEVSGGLSVIIVVKELPKLSALEFVGNKEIATKDIRDKLGLGVGGYISPYLIESRRQQILEMYADKGYFRAEVRPDLDYTDDSTAAALTYHIDERSKVKVEKVVLTGNSRVPANDLIKKMRNRKRGFLRSSNFAQEKYQEDLEKIAEEYHKRGFVDASVVSDSISIDSVNNRMTIYIEVYEGPLYYFGKSEFAGNEIIKEPVLRRALEHNEGDIFNAETYDKSLMEVYTTYQDIGHLHARISDERSTRNDSIIDIRYEINEGLPSHINLIKIVGNHKTRENVIRREILSLPGQVFNRTLLVQSVRDVMALNFFANVQPVPVNLPNGDVDIEFEIEEKQTGQISAGAGYNSQDKVVGNVGLGIPNFRGTGQNISLNVEFGGRRNSVSLSFTEPWLYGRPTLFGADIFSTNRRWFDDYTEQRQGAAVRLGRRLRWPDRFFRAFTSYRLERTRYHDFDENYRISNSYKDIFYHTVAVVDSTPPLDTVAIDSTVVRVLRPYPGSPLEFGERWNTASRIGFTLSRDSRNLPEFATSGSQLSYNFETTGGFMGGYWNYQKHEISAAKFIPLFWRFSLAAKVQYGAIRAGQGDQRILLSDRFSPGGTAYDGIVRGYDDGDLTPDSIVTEVTSRYYVSGSNYSDPLTADSVVSDTISFTSRVRGKYQLIFNLELQVPIVERTVYGLLFFDAGNSWLYTDRMKLFGRPSDSPNVAGGLYKGAGFGFRVAVPGIGTIGFDFGWPLDKFKNEPQKLKTHFQIGTTFR